MSDRPLEFFIDKSEIFQEDVIELQNNQDCKNTFESCVNIGSFGVKKRLRNLNFEKSQYDI